MGLVIPISFFHNFFLGGHLPQTSSFRLAKQILVVSSATQVRACILSDHNIFCTLGEGQQQRSLMPSGAFLDFFWGGGGGHLPQTSGLCSAKQILVVSLGTQVRARILSDRNIFCTLVGGGGDNNGRV